jgi:hypothetical protein
LNEQHVVLYFKGRGSRGRRRVVCILNFLSLKRQLENRD